MTTATPTADAKKAVKSLIRTMTQAEARLSKAAEKAAEMVAEANRLMDEAVTAYNEAVAEAQTAIDELQAEAQEYADDLEDDDDEVDIADEVAAQLNVTLEEVGYEEATAPEVNWPTEMAHETLAEIEI